MRVNFLLLCNIKTNTIQSPKMLNNFFTHCTRWLEMLPTDGLESTNSSIFRTWLQRILLLEPAFCSWNSKIMITSFSLIRLCFLAIPGLESCLRSLPWRVEDKWICWTLHATLAFVIPLSLAAANMIYSHVLLFGFGFFILILITGSTMSAVSMH